MQLIRYFGLKIVHRRGIAERMIYCTHYSIEDCIGLLSRKNTYDVFEYSFEMKTETMGEITFIRCNKHLWNGLRSLYQIEFESDETTTIRMEFIREGSVFPFSTLFPEWINEFMEQKLSATEKKPDVE